MMRRTILFSAAVVLPLLSGAQHKNVYFHQNDGITRVSSTENIDSIGISKDQSAASFHFEGKRSVSYNLGMLDSITFNKTIPGASAFPAASDFKRTVSDTAEPDYSNVPEPKPSTDDSDFIENFTVKNNIKFTFNGNSVTVSGSVNGVTVKTSGAHVTVLSTKGKMRYLLEGTTSDGSFKVITEEGDADNKKFCLTLNGVNITNPKGPAINIQSGKSVYLLLNKNTVNTLCDGATYSTSASEDQKGTIFSEGQLLISGSGTLNITSLGGHGICSDDYIRLRANTGKISITSFKDGFNTKDKFIMYGGDITINSSKDGVSVRRGPFCLYGGSLDMTCADDGIVSDYTNADTANVTIEGGYARIYTTGSKGHAIATTGALIMKGGAVSATVTGNASKCFNVWNGISIQGGTALLKASGEPMYDEEEKEFSSSACIRSRKNLTVSGGTLSLLNTGNGGKGINTELLTDISGGTVTVVSEGDDYAADGISIRSRALDTRSLAVSGTPSVNLSAAKVSLSTIDGMDVSGGSIITYSTGSRANALNVKGTLKQSGGLIMYGLSE
ncbi:MAG: carbohydrate-binding domain-containing protein [Bacteroidaceae bacterium]|nr:carbohydrate-binding domain-containing protein [Bacteroidaceae bacterium]